MLGVCLMSRLAHEAACVPILHHLEGHSIWTVRMLALMQRGYVRYLLEL